MDYDATAQVMELANLPPEAPKPVAKWNGWSAPLRGLAAGAGEAAAFVADSVKGYGEVMGATGTQSAGGMFSLQSDKERRDTELQRIKNDTQGLDTTSEIGTSLRNVARDYRPDPNTAGLAERLTFDLTRFLGKAVGYTVAGAGVPGAVMLGADEAMVTADDLGRLGVNQETRMQAGAVAGVAAAAGVLLPVAAPASIAKTIGLWALGGPGGFIAQQQATREILARANYTELSQQYDPLDPVGLAVSSLVPAGFAAYAVRGARVHAGADPVAKPGAVEPPPPAHVEPTLAPEELDAVMTHNLTLARDVREALTGPTEIVRAQADAQIVDLQAQRAELLPDAGNLAERGAIRTARKELNALEQSRPDNSPEAVRARAKEIQADKGTSYKAALSAATKEIDGIVSEHAATVARITGFIDANARAQQAVGRIADIDRNIELLQREVDFLDVGARAREASDRSTIPDVLPDSAPARPVTEVDLFAARLAKSEDQAVRNVGEGIKKAADVLGSEQITAITRAADEFVTARATGDAAAKTMEALDLPPEVKNLLAGIVENAHSPARIEAMAREVMKTVSDFKTQAADVTADAVERLRSLTDAQITNTPAAPAKVKADPLLDSIAERIARVEQMVPDMVVRTDEAGQPVTVAKELARIREESRVGTDTELGAADAELVNVAANCAIGTGA